MNHERTSMSLVDEAKTNLEMAGLFSKDSDYEGAIGKAVMELVEVFAKQGHSGGSAFITIEAFYRCAKRKPLTAKYWDYQYEQMKAFVAKNGGGEWTKEQHEQSNGKRPEEGTKQ